MLRCFTVITGAESCMKVLQITCFALCLQLWLNDAWVCCSLHTTPLIHCCSIHRWHWPSCNCTDTLLLWKSAMCSCSWHITLLYCKEMSVQLHNCPCYLWMLLQGLPENGLLLSQKCWLWRVLLDWWQWVRYGVPVQLLWQHSLFLTTSMLLSVPGWPSYKLQTPWSATQGQTRNVE